MPQNNCTPQNVYGPFEHTLFLGCSVISFTATAGYNNQVSELTVRLARDPCNPLSGSKKYYNHFLAQGSWTGPDPGFFGSSLAIGGALYFRVNEFEFCGLLQSWTETNSPAGYPVYEVVIVDPRQILENAQIIIGGYAGGVGVIPNVINVYGFMESFGVQNPQTTINGATFGTPAGGFGGSNTNANGMPWNSILGGLQVLLGSVVPFGGIFNPYGRLMFRGPATSFINGIDACGILHNDSDSSASYFVDLSELPVDYTGLIRIAGTSVGLLDLISQMCSEAGCDYYIELLPVPTGTGGFYKVIKVRVISRVAVPIDGAIAGFIGSAVGVESNSKGYELRNETVSAVVVGGMQQTIYQAFQSTSPPNTPQDPYTPPDENRWVILPYWGQNPDGSVIETTYVDDLWVLNPSTASLNFQLVSPLNENYIKINEVELRMALAGMDSWLSYLYSFQTETWNALNNANPSNDKTEGIFKGEALVVIAQNVARAAGRDFVGPNVKGYREIDAALEKDLQTIFQFVLTFAKDYYGRKFAIRLPYTAVTTDSETGNQYTSEVPSDGGWTDEGEVLGLPNPSVGIDFFSLEDNRLGCFVATPAWCGPNQDRRVDVSNMNVDDYGLYNDYVYIRASVDPKIYWVGNSPRVVVSLPQAVLCTQEQGSVQKASAGVAAAFGVVGDAAKDVAIDAMKGVGGALLNWGMENVPVFIYAAAIPLKSNVATYASDSWAVTGGYGAVKFIQDEELNPWNYGGTLNMIAAGYAKVAQELTLMQVAEMGTVSVAGYPTLPLGAEIGAYTGLAGKGLFSNRSASVGSSSVGGYSVLHTDVISGGWTGLYGPNISQINVDVSPQGVRTQYVMRTFTPKFGRFSKYNADRIRDGGAQRLRNQRLSRRFNSLNAMSAGLRDQGAIEDRRAMVNSVNARASKTPHEVLVGEFFPWHKDTPGDDEFTRTIVATEDMKELGLHFEKNYDKKAFMSLDGLVRPVSLYGAGGLPQLTAKSTTCNKTTSPCAIPPISGAYNVEITNLYLNFLTNPDDDMHADSCKGHDIDLVGRGTTPPANSLVMPIDGYEDGTSQFANDYRFFALRGPLFIHGWGYDTNGKPIPNSADTEASTLAGTFQHTNLTDKFPDDWLRKPQMWPVGPVDLRWDRARGVWVAPPAYKFLRVTLQGSLSPNGSTQGLVTNAPTLWSSGGTSITNPKIDIHGDGLNSALASGTKATVYYDADDCKYYVMSSAGSGGPAATGSGLWTFVSGIQALDPSGGNNRLRVTYNQVRIAGTFVSGWTSDISIPDATGSGGGSSEPWSWVYVPLVIGGSCVSGQVQLETADIQIMCDSRMKPNEGCG